MQLDEVASFHQPLMGDVMGARRRERLRDGFAMLVFVFVFD